MFWFRMPEGYEAGEGCRVNERVAVRAVIWAESSLLMIYTNKGDYKLPGGGVEDGESHEAALVREVLEETGYTVVSVGRKLGEVLEGFPDSFSEGAFFEMTSHYYECTVGEIQVGQNLDDYEKLQEFTPGWISVDDAIRRNRAITVQAKSKNRWVERELRVLEILAGVRK